MRFKMLSRPVIYSCPDSAQAPRNTTNVGLCLLGGAVLGGGLIYLLTRKLGPFGPVLGGFGQTSSLTETIKNAVDVHIRQIRRYAFASSQDISPIVGLTHASYSLVLLDTLEEIVGRDALSKTGVDPGKLRKFITALQDKHAETLKQCDQHLQHVLAIERGEGGQLPGFVVAGAGAAPRGA